MDIYWIFWGILISKQCKSWTCSLFRFLASIEFHFEGFFVWFFFESNFSNNIDVWHWRSPMKIQYRENMTFWKDFVCGSLKAMTSGNLQQIFHMNGGYHQQDIIVFITDFDFQLSTNIYGPSYKLFSPSDPKVSSVHRLSTFLPPGAGVLRVTG